MDLFLSMCGIEAPSISEHFSHLSKLYLEGKNIDLKQYVTAEEMFKLANAKKVLQNEKALKPYYEFLNEKLTYEKIRIGLTILEKK